MTHPEELLAPYVDGTASPEERAAVDSHASTCSRCRAEISAASAARAELKRLPVVEAPPGLAPGPFATPSARPSRAPGWYRWGGAAAAAAVIVLLVVMVLPRSGSNPSTATAASDAGTTEAALPVALENPGPRLRGGGAEAGAQDRGRGRSGRAGRAHLPRDEHREW